jgi:hypothetical protein
MVLAWQEPNLTPAHRLVLLALADCADLEGRNAFVGERSISEHTTLSLRTVKTAIKALRVRGLIVVQALPTNRRSTTYQLQLSGGANRAPMRGANDAPPVGANAAPLEVISRVQSWVQNLQIPHTPYKEDPVDPVDPGAVSLLSKAVIEIWTANPALDGVGLVSQVTHWARARRLPHDIDTIGKAIDLARSARQQVPA